MTADEQAALCADYRIGDAVSCESLGGTRNRNFRLTTTRGVFVVRDRYVGYRDPARLAFDHAALEFLQQHGVPVVAPIHNARGDTSTQSGQRLWEVFPHTEARHFHDADADDLRALAQALALFHRVGKQFNAPSPLKLGPRGETDPAELRTIIEKLRADAGDSLMLYEQWTNDAARDLSDSIYASLPESLIHGDIQPANILIGADGNIAALVDFDWCDRRPRIYDLAFAILLCCATHESPIDGGDIWSLSQSPLVQPDLARLFLQTYESHGWPLSHVETNALRSQIILSWCHVRLAGALKVEPARRHEFLARPPHDLAALGILELSS